MRFTSCDFCGTEPEVQCPRCGSDNVYASRAHEIDCSYRQGRSAADLASERFPDYACLNCRTGLEIGRRNNQLFRALTEFADSTTPLAGPPPVRLWAWEDPGDESLTPEVITAPPEQRVIDLIQDLRLILDNKLVAQPVVTDQALADIDLGPTADPWWWRGMDLRVVCSNPCLDDLFDAPTSLDELASAATSRLSVWHLPKDGQWRSAAETQLDPAVASLAHVSTESDRIGSWFIIDPGLSDTFAFDRTHVADPRMLHFSADIIWPPVPTWDSSEEGMPGEPDTDPREPEPMGVLLLDIALQTGKETFPFGEVELEVPERFVGEEPLLVDVPKWLARRLILDGDADVDRLSDLIAATIAAQFNLPGEDTSKLLPPHHLAVEAIKTLRNRHKTEATDIVWGTSPWGPVFLRKADAESWAQTWFALQRSKTWGELRHRIPPTQIGWMEETLEWCSYDMEHLDDRTDVSGLGTSLGEGTLWPWLANTTYQEEDILGELPPHVWQILDEEEEDLVSTPDGCYVLYRDGERIAEAIESVGFLCERNDQLIVDAHGPFSW